MSKSKLVKPETGGGVMDTLSCALPDERPITALQVVENSGKCPAGYWPVLKTYDEDSDADLWRQPVVFGKRSCRYLCISKSEGGGTSTVTALCIVGSGDPPPVGYTCLSKTADSRARAWRKRQLCYRLDLAGQPITDIILCSRLKKAPEGFQYAGEINGVTLCFKVRGASQAASPAHVGRPNSHLVMWTPGMYPELITDDTNYENVLSNGHTPENKRMLRAPPERPPKASSLVAELNKLNLQQENGRAASPSPVKRLSTGMVESPSNHDYESLSPGYILQPVRVAPPLPGAPPRPPRSRPAPPLGTLAHYSATGVEGVPFALNSKLCGEMPGGYVLPVIKRRTKFQLDQEYRYSFVTERQT